MEKSEEMQDITIKVPKKVLDSWQLLATVHEFDFPEYVQDLLVGFLEDKLAEMKREFQ